MRLCHAKKFAKLSVGTVLTYEMFRHILATETVTEIDFGPGGAPFKRQWLAFQRERGGFLAFNRRTLKGTLLGTLHIGGRFAKAILRRAWHAARRLAGRS
jgi:CelD/BcsL family acetyltransferase involved in cellulose biosynthesis